MTATTRYRAVTLDRELSNQGRRKDWLAEQVGVHPSIISHLLAGRRTADSRLARAIADALNVDDIFLLFELPDGNKNVTSEQAA